MIKKRYVIGNWKMYKTAREATDYIEELIPLVEGSQVNIYISVPYTSIHAASQYAKGTNIVIGAQNMNDAREGAFTGEIAALMLKEAGAAFVLLGHSERRALFAETDELISKKVLRALQDDIQPILCIGESLEEKKSSQTEKVLEKQLGSVLENVPKDAVENLLIAYEPVWAIGTGKTPTPKQIQEVHSFIRQYLTEMFGKKLGVKIPILYGGSVKPENVAMMTDEKGMDGVLVGGASLDPKTLAGIIRQVEKGMAPKKLKPSKEEKKK